jgi:hypothetical protein
MVAHFSSRLKQQINATLVVILLAFCMLGTHWVGLAHNISHLGVIKQTACTSVDVAGVPSASHSSEACHLFDALSLAGYVPPSYTTSLLLNSNQPTTIQFEVARKDSPSLIVYQSQAPPFFIL